MFPEDTSKISSPASRNSSATIIPSEISFPPSIQSIAEILAEIGFFFWPDGADCVKDLQR